jgi:hypothetical protein
LINGEPYWPPSPPSVLQWTDIQRGLRGVWPAIERDGPVDHEVESFLTHARRSVMRDGIDKEDRKKKSYHSCGSLVELETLGAKRGRNRPAVIQLSRLTRPSPSGSPTPSWARLTMGNRTGRHHSADGLLQGTVSGGPPNLGLPVPPLSRRPPLGPPVDGHSTGTQGCMARYQGRRSS